MFLLLLQNIPFICHIYRTKGNSEPITFSTFFWQKIIGFNRQAYWPMHRTSVVTGVKNISIGIDTAPGLGHGCYIQAMGKITIGNYTTIAPNVGIISSNHSIYNHKEHIINQVIIGDYCWIGMGAIILPGVILGPHTIVAAGAVVTKSFVDGFCVIAGNPAKKIKNIESNQCVEFKNKWEYNGYIPHHRFANYKNSKLH